MLSLTTFRSSARSSAISSTHGRDHPARPAPRRPEVDEHGLVGLENLGLEVVVGDFGDGACHASFSFSGYFKKYRRVAGPREVHWNACGRARPPQLAGAIAYLQTMADLTNTEIAAALDELGDLSELDGASDLPRGGLPQRRQGGTRAAGVGARPGARGPRHRAARRSARLIQEKIVALADTGRSPPRSSCGPSSRPA